MPLENIHNPDSSRVVHHPLQDESSDASIAKVAIAALLVCALTLTAATASIAIFNPTVAIAATIVAVACLICTIAGMILGISLNQCLNENNDYSNPYIRGQQAFEEQSSSVGISLKPASDVKQEEVAAYSQGLPNPSSNCFMNAMLQNAFSLDQLGTYITTSLETISQDPSQNKNPFLDDFSIVLPQDKGESNDALEARKQPLKGQYSTQRPQFITIKEHTLESVLNTYFKNKDCFDDFYKALSLKDAATYALAIIKKWRSKTLISSDEAKLLRVALIKLMNKQLSLEFNRNGTNPIWRFPGINQGVKINFGAQECPAEFFGQLIDSLEELTKSSPSPCSLKVTEIVKGSQKQSSRNTPLIIYSIKSTQTSLDLGSLTEIEDTYQKRANTSYKVTLPEEMIMQIKLNNLNQKKKIKLQFTDENNLRITLASQALSIQSKTYQLESFVVHRGFGTTSGHYINYIKKTRPDGSSFWIEQNDRYSRSIDSAAIKELLNGEKGPYMTPYMLAFKAV